MTTQEQADYDDKVKAAEALLAALQRCHRFAVGNGWTDADYHDADGTGWVTSMSQAIEQARRAGIQQTPPPKPEPKVWMVDYFDGAGFRQIDEYPTEQEARDRKDAVVRLGANAADVLVVPEEH